MIPPESPRRIPLAAKVTYSAFVAVLVPFYYNAYGPSNFLYFCDTALLLAVAAVWLESPLLASAPMVGIFLPQMIWVVDFLSTFAGHPLTGMTGYMFDRTLPLFMRFLSFFHFWLPFFLLWAVARLGYDRRGLALWSAIGWALMLVSYTLLPPPPAPAEKAWMPVNVNYVFGFDPKGPQTWMAPLPYLLAYGAVLQVAIWWPTHRVLARYLATTPKPRAAAWHDPAAVAHDV